MYKSSLPVIKLLVRIGDTSLQDECNVDSNALNFSQPIVFDSKDYEGNTNLIRALLCLPNRKESCAKCRIGRFNLLACRVRKAHMNIDFDQWFDYLKRVGGVNGLMKLLNPSYVPPIMNLVPAGLSAITMNAQNPLSTAYSYKINEVVTTTTESSYGKTSDGHNMTASMES